MGRGSDDKPGVQYWRQPKQVALDPLPLEELGELCPVSAPSCCGVERKQQSSEPQGAGLAFQRHVQEHSHVPLLRFPATEGVL